MAVGASIFLPKPTMVTAALGVIKVRAIMMASTVARLVCAPSQQRRADDGGCRAEIEESEIRYRWG